MLNATKFGDLCYILPHQNKSFCFLFSNSADEVIFESGVINFNCCHIVDEWRLFYYATNFATFSSSSSRAKEEEETKYTIFFPTSRFVFLMIMERVLEMSQKMSLFQE